MIAAVVGALSVVTGVHYLLSFVHATIETTHGPRVPSEREMADFAADVEGWLRSEGY